MKKWMFGILFAITCLSSQWARSATSAKTRLDLQGEVTQESVAPLIEALAKPGDVELWIDSPGGSVGAGLELMSAMDSHKGKITCVVGRYAMAASMAALIFEGCDERVLFRTSTLMFHGISVGLSGYYNVGALEELLKMMRVVNEVAADIACRTSTYPECKTAVVSEGLWLTGTQAAIYGFADAVVW